MFWVLRYSVVLLFIAVLLCLYCDVHQFIRSAFDFVKREIFVFHFCIFVSECCHYKPSGKTCLSFFFCLKSHYMRMSLVLMNTDSSDCRIT